ncbi:MAG: hypothetical protein HYR72_05260 [Deltaproteobacteria bacterium]|nr:hypothetical protein [Deltaproteobacteria bacterium]MBI3389703.1 hypothetical protein [Deltaproteobacteria bacterium]
MAKPKKEGIHWVQRGRKLVRIVPPLMARTLVVDQASTMAVYLGKYIGQTLTMRIGSGSGARIVHLEAEQARELAYSLLLAAERLSMYEDGSPAEPGFD